MTILVTGATGTVGSEILTLLCEQGGESVRALVRNESKAAQFANQTVKPFMGDLEDRSSVDAAMRGVDTLVLITSANPVAESHASNAIAAAQTAGTKKIVRLSAIKASIDGPTDNTRAHAKTEDEIVSSGLRYVFLRPNLFMQNLFLVAAEIAEFNRFSFATGDGRIGMIDARDIAACMASCSLSSQWDGATFELTGPAAISYFDVASELSTLCHRTISYNSISSIGLYDSITNSGWGEWMAGITRDYAEAYSAGWGNFTTETVRQITGKDPRSFGTFADELLVPAIC